MITIENARKKAKEYVSGQKLHLGKAMDDGSTKKQRICYFT